MICRCRHCKKEYESSKSRGNYRGFCTATCEHAKAKELGYSKAREAKGGRSEYDVLKDNNQLGDLPIALEKVTALFKVNPHNAKKHWWWRLGPQTLAKHEAALAKIEDVQVEWQRKGYGDKWQQVHQRKDAEGAVVRIRKPGW